MIALHRRLSLYGEEALGAPNMDMIRSGIHYKNVIFFLNVNNISQDDSEIDGSIINATGYSSRDRALKPCRYS